MFADTDPSVRRWIRTAERSGWGVIFTRSGHVRFTHPTTGKHTVIPRRAGDSRGARNAQAELRRGGLDV